MTFLDTHDPGELLPHAILPLQIVFLHALVVITLPTLPDTDGTHLGEIGIDVAGDEVVVLVGLVYETEDDILEAGQLVLAVGELERVVGELLAEFDSVVGGLTLTVSGDNKEGA